VALEALYFGMLAHKFNGVHCHVNFFPVFGGSMAGVTIEGFGHIVRAHVAGIAIFKLDVQVALSVAIQTHAHRADNSARYRVESVSHPAVAITTQHIALPLFGEFDDFAVGGAQAVLGYEVR